MPRVLTAGLALLISCAALRASAAPPYDLLIVNGLLVDGSGAPPRRADLAVSGGRIARVGRIPRAEAREVIEARGLVVAPGFIDVHTHADDLAAHPLAGNFVRMGVTTVVAGNCGRSTLDVAEALLAVERAAVSVNYATLIGHNTVRRAVMGEDDRLPTIGEMARMRSLVWRAMADGAVGFSTGLQYTPGAFARAPEIQDLARIAGNAGGVYATHLRNEGTRLEEALEEALNVGATTRVRVQISHLKVDSPSRWGASARALAMLDAARERGVHVVADQYAYTAASAPLGIRFPSWALEGGAGAVAARLADPVEWAKIRDETRQRLAGRGLSDLSFAVVARHAFDPSLNGLNMREVARRLVGTSSFDAQLEAARRMMIAGGASMVYHLMSDADVERIMRHPFVAIASDGGAVTPGRDLPHPRSSGNTARVLGEYVRVRRIISLAEAVRKMTSLPAEHFRIAGRGLLREQYAADIVVIDPAAVRDAATFSEPHREPDGIPHVVVNGTVVVRNGAHTGARPGRAVTRAPEPQDARRPEAERPDQSSSAR